MKISLSNLFEETTGISIEEFDKLVRSGFVDKIELEKTLLWFWEAMKENPKEIVKHLFNSKKNVEQYGEVFTSFKIINKMFDTQFPLDDWKNPNLRWIDKFCGSGNFLIVIYERLMDGLEGWEPDRDLRRKHILENMLYGIDIRPTNVLLSKIRLDPDNVYNLNIVCADTLKFDFWGGMKFHREATNPPFNIGVITEDHRFYKEKWNIARETTAGYFASIQITSEILTDDGISCQIVPTGFISNDTASVFRDEVLKMVKIDEIVVLSKEVFTDIVKPTCFFRSSNIKNLSNFSTNVRIKRVFKGKEYITDINQYDNYIFGLYLGIEHYQLVRAIDSYNGNGFMEVKRGVQNSGKEKPFFNEKQTGDFKNPTFWKLGVKDQTPYFQIQYSSKKQSTWEHKVLFPADSGDPNATEFQSIKTSVVDNNGFGYTWTINAIKCDNPTQATLINDVLMHDIMQLYFNARRTDRNFTCPQVRRLQYPKNLKPGFSQQDMINEYNLQLLKSWIDNILKDIK